MTDIVTLSTEIQNDTSKLGYGDKALEARRINPNDDGAQDVVVADLLNEVNLPPVSGIVELELVINTFTGEEWGHAMFLFDLLASVKRVRVGDGTIFNKGLALLVTDGSLTTQRAQEISNTIMATLPKMSRAQQLGLDFVTTSDVANARRIIGSVDNIATLGPRGNGTPQAFGAK